ncbi:hypothetical protein KLP40_07545 [Hymenobacter sp. NST-14]|uniref:hypothetical protein n=1 Tax=Hymenobacter piscis TaxID=2839984 RepID=UPI001C00B630|nr:hypothetical protein [Hymenobacter piscis]MBT9393012.1 hypothetical protein [Hymenobacter piscis]
MRALLLFVLLAFSSYSWACSCGKVGILKNRKQAELIFTGRVIDIRNFIYKDSTDRGNGEYIIRTKQSTKFTFQVQHVYKGAVVTDTVSLSTPAARLDCESHFVPNQSYLVYSNLTTQSTRYLFGAKSKARPYLTTNLCTRTKRNRLLTIYEKAILTLL